MKTYKLNGEEVIIEISRYSFNNSLALCLKTVKGEPYAVLSVNIADSDNIEENQCFIDVNNCPWAMQFLSENNIGNFTGQSGESGFCIYPLYDFETFVQDYFLDLEREIRSDAKEKNYNVYQVGFSSFNFEIHIDGKYINLTATKDQTEKLLDVLSMNNFINTTEENEDYD